MRDPQGASMGRRAAYHAPRSEDGPIAQSTRASRASRLECEALREESLAAEGLRRLSRRSPRATLRLGCSPAGRAVAPLGRRQAECPRALALEG